MDGIAHVCPARHACVPASGYSYVSSTRHTRVDKSSFYQLRRFDALRRDGGQTQVGGFHGEGDGDGGHNILK